MMEKYVTGIIFFGMMMLFSYVHECAHMAAAGRLVRMGVRDDMTGQLREYYGTGTGTRNRGIFGNVMYLKQEFTAAKKMAVYMAGPAANIIILLAIYGVAKGLIFIKITYGVLQSFHIFRIFATIKTNILTKQNITFESLFCLILTSET